jgi:Family of unknown function (DUF6151)
VSTDLPLRCRCGAVRGVATNLAPGSGNRIVCHCDDCQAFAHFLKRRDVLDDAGGTDILQIPPSRVRITEGVDQIRSVRLSERGLVRWYTDCCRTPIGNMIGPRLPFIGIIGSFMDHEADGRSRDDVLGAPLGFIFGKFAVGKVPAHVHPKVPPGVMLRMGSRILGWWLTERGAPNAFFDPATRAPHSVPQVLSREERAALSKPTTDAPST